MTVRVWLLFSSNLLSSTLTLNKWSDTLFTKCSDVHMYNNYDDPITHSTVQYSTVQYNTIQYNTVQYSTLLV